MRYVFGALVIIFSIVLATGLVTGRIKAKSCCAPSDPKRDLRMNPHP